MHILKDCNNHQHLVEHELVPIITMNNQALPEVLDNIPQHSIQIQDQLILPPPMQTQMLPNVLTGVYTLQEEPELEMEANSTI